MVSYLVMVQVLVRVVSLLVLLQRTGRSKVMTICLFCRGLHKAIWISESNDLVYDAQRDLRDIGFGDIPVLSLRDSPYGAVSNPKTFV